MHVANEEAIPYPILKTYTILKELKHILRQMDSRLGLVRNLEMRLVLMQVEFRIRLVGRRVDVRR